MSWFGLIQTAEASSKLWLWQRNRTVVYFMYAHENRSADIRDIPYCQQISRPLMHNWKWKHQQQCPTTARIFTYAGVIQKYRWCYPIFLLLSAKTKQWPTMWQLFLYISLVFDDNGRQTLADFDLFLFFNHRCYVLYKHFCSVATQEITEIMKNGKLLVFTQLLEATLTKRAGC